ncbi:hypothetical protein BJ508DRAFT_410713 [Ascobolus immersus RN42]|uniref:Dihydrofolate reductase n=1 Tax=Ascobolus immersus RN42 TaxID=1160509 RepID=A0A3N4IMR1_ASCIM|nr:hypothetical protein BJ508DRAFT_410713 [Ascobolus immersus RN42]
MASQSTSTVPRLTLIVAATPKRLGIGRNGQLPWRIPAELAYFARVTKACPPNKRNAVIMGRKTYDSIPPKFRPLPERLNVILTRQKGWTLPEDELLKGAVVREGFTEALEALGNDENIHRVFIIGGAEIYRETIKHQEADRVLLTVVEGEGLDDVEGEKACDTTFEEARPVIEEKEGWTRRSDEELREWTGETAELLGGVAKGVKYEYRMYTR